MQIKMAASSYHKGGLFITLANLNCFVQGTPVQIQCCLTTRKDRKADMGVC